LVVKKNPHLCPFAQKTYFTNYLKVTTMDTTTLIVGLAMLIIMASPIVLFNKKKKKDGNDIKD